MVPASSAISNRHSEPSLNNYFFVARRLVLAATLLARDPAAVVPFNRGSHHAAALSWADGDTTRADANCGVGVVPPATVPIVAVVAVPPDLNIDALGHLDALGLGRSGERGSRQHSCGCRHGKNATSSALSTALSQQPSLVGQKHGPDHPIIGRLRLAASSQL